MRSILKLATVVLLSIVPLQLHAADAKWFKATSDHFLLFTDTSEQKGQRLLADFEARLSALESAVGPVPARQFPIEIFLFSKSEDFVEAIPRGAANVDKAAFLISGPDRSFVIARDKSPDAISNDVGHALGHLFFERLVLWRPFWLAEGVAEYFRKVGRDPDTKRISEQDGNTAADLLKIVPSPTYRDEEAVSDGVTYQEKDFGVLFRVQAHRLLRTILDNNPSEFRAWIEALRTEAGDHATLPGDRDDLNTRFAQYMETRIVPGKTGFDVRTEAANMEDLAIQRGDLLVATGKTSDAAQWYKATTPQALAARAILARFTRTGGEAIQLLDRASAQLPDSGLPRFHLGSIETQTPKDIALQVTALERAIQLLPRLGQARAQLARVYILSGKAEAALPLLDQAVALEPESADRSYALRAEALLALRRFEESFKTVQVAAALPHLERGAAAEAYALKVTSTAKRIEDARRELDSRRLEQIREEIGAKVAVLEPPKPVVLPPPVRSGQIRYDIEATQRVEVVESVMPVFADALVQKGTVGKVALKVTVAPNGKVTAATITSSQIPEMNAITLAAAGKWTFKPVERAGRAVAFTITLVFQFTTQ